MRLSELISHLSRRFPRSAEVLTVEIAIAAEGGSGIVEVVTFDADSLDADDPDEGEPAPKPRLRLAS